MPTTPPPPARRRVLVVDDDAALRGEIRQTLGALGLEVDAVGDGLAALMRLDQARPDLVVTELLLPGLDGIRLLRALRSRSETRAIPVIVATARDDPATMIDVTAMGVRAVLTKPYSMAELLARVNRLLPGAVVGPPT